MKKNTTGERASRMAQAIDIAEKTESRTSPYYLRSAPVTSPAIQQKTDTVIVEATNTTGSFAATYAAISRVGP